MLEMLHSSVAQLFQQQSIFTDELIKNVKLQDESQLRDLMNSNNLRIQVLEDQYKTQSIEIDELKLKNKELVKLIEDFNTDLAKATRMQVRAQEKLHSNQLQLGMYEEETTDYLSITSRFKKLLDQNYSSELEGTLGLEILKDFNVQFQKWRIQEKGLLSQIANSEAGVTRTVMGTINQQEQKKHGLHAVSFVDKKCDPMSDFLNNLTVETQTDVLNKDIYTRQELIHRREEKKKQKVGSGMIIRTTMIFDSGKSGNRPDLRKASLEKVQSSGKQQSNDSSDDSDDEKSLSSEESFKTILQSNRENQNERPRSRRESFSKNILKIGSINPHSAKNNGSRKSIFSNSKRIKSPPAKQSPYATKQRRASINPEGKSQFAGISDKSIAASRRKSVFASQALSSQNLLGGDRNN